MLATFHHNKKISGKMEHPHLSLCDISSKETAEHISSFKSNTDLYFKIGRREEFTCLATKKQTMEEMPVTLAQALPSL